MEGIRLHRGTLAERDVLGLSIEPKYFLKLSVAQSIKHCQVQEVGARARQYDDICCENHIKMSIIYIFSIS